jgi:hypothetical protein
MDRKILVVLGMLIIFVWGLSACAANQPKFELISGDEAVVVLLRGEESGTYRLSYEGNEAGQIQSVRPMIAGEILHVDVAQTLLRSGEQEVILDDNQVQEGQIFQLQPGAEFEIELTYRGQTIGYNYLHGFQITMATGEGNSMIEVIDPQAPDYNYLIAVE